MNSLYDPTGLQLHDNLTADSRYPSELVSPRLLVSAALNECGVWGMYLLLFEGHRLAVRVRFDAADVVRGCGVEDLHQALQRVLQSDISAVSAATTASRWKLVSVNATQGLTWLSP